MLKLLKFPVGVYNPLLELHNGKLANIFFLPTRLKSKHDSGCGPVDKKKMCGPVKGKEKKEEKKAHKHEKKGDDKCKEKGSKGKESGKKKKEEKSDGSSDEGGIPEIPRIGINGFGRIGRTAIRIATEYNCPLEIVAVNDPGMKADYMTYLLKYDSVHGRFMTDVHVDGKQIIIDGKKRICTYSEKDPKNIPWKDLGVEYVIEASGKNTTAEKCQGHFEAGAKHVVVSAPCKDDSPTFVVGVNLEDYDPSMKVVSAASCATNALAPIVKVLHDKFHVIEGFMTTVHAITSSQKLLDQASDKNWRESRSGMLNMIPTYTGAAVAVARVLPEMKGKMTALSVRVPTPNVSMIDLTVRVKESTCLEEIVKAMEEAADDTMLGVMEVTHDHVVSTDFVGSHYSSIFDAKASMELNPNFFKLIGWFDNEYGYTCRVIDLIKFIHAERKEAAAQEC